MNFVIVIIALVALAVGGYGAIALTEVGQMINLPRSWVFGFFEHRYLLNIIIVILAVIAVGLALSSSFIRRRWVLLYSLAIVACLFFINIFAPELWLRAQQHNASFMSLSQADQRLDEDDDVFVLEINGDARAYPRDWMQLPHIVGHNVGGQDTVMTYCALSNLPLAFDPKLDGKNTDFRVIAQVNNNLIFTDRNSGELIQQVTATAEYSQSTLEQYPVQRMPWGTFKLLYPDGQVFDYQPTWFDRATLSLFDSALAPHYQGQPMFPTLHLNDKRLPPQVQVWGVIDGDDAVAVQPESFAKENQLIAEINGKIVLFVFYPELQTVGAFWVDAEHDWSALKVDPYGQYEGGKLKRANLYSGMPWMVWSHWFPHTRII